MEKVLLNIDKTRMFYAYCESILPIVLVSIALCAFSTIPVFVIVGVMVFCLLKFVVLSRSMRVIVEIDVCDDKIVLMYYKFWMKRSIEITRNTFEMVQVRQEKDKFNVSICDKRFINPPCMSITYEENSKKSVWTSKEEIESAIKLFEKHHYHVEYS